MEKKPCNSELTSYLDLEEESRADICFAPQHVSSVYQHSISNHELLHAVSAEETIIMLGLQFSFISHIHSTMNRKKRFNRLFNSICFQAHGP